MDDKEKMLLADALSTAIRQSRLIIRLKRAVIALSICACCLVIALIVK